MIKSQGHLNGPVTIAQSAIPVVLPSSGTITAGVLSALTALPTQYAGCWMYFPAGASLPSGAGLYWVVPSSTTGGQIYTAFQNTGNAFTPYIPSSPVAITSGGAAYTQTTAVDIPLVNINVPGGMMGANGKLRCVQDNRTVNNANAKSVRFLLNGQQFSGAIPYASGAAGKLLRELTNRGVQNAQIAIATSSPTCYGIASALDLTVDTSVNQPLTFTAQLTVATDYLVLEGFTVEVLPA